MNYRDDFKGEIREAVEADLREVLKIERKSFDHPWESSISYRLLNKDFFFVYEENDLILGYIIARVGKAKSTGILSPFSRGREFLRLAHILNLAVIPERRRQGIGTHLLKEIEEMCIENGLEVIALEVRIENTTAFKFYSTHGFAPKRIIPSYYENGDNAFLMGKSL